MKLLRRGTRLVVASAAMAALVGCRPASEASLSNDAQATASADKTALEQDYVAPPQVLRADVTGSGIVVLRGAAGPGAKIQFQSPEGESHSTMTRRSGLWALRLPPVQRPRMFAVSEIFNGRIVHAEGALIILPRPAPAAILARAGFGALILDHPATRSSITTIDYDPGGFAAFSGTAAPNAAVRLFLDGSPAGLTQADSTGRYAVLAANHRLDLGPHLASIQTGPEEIRRRFELVQPVPLSSPYAANAEAGGWHVEWAPAGGGVQTTLVLGPQ